MTLRALAAETVSAFNELLGVSRGDRSLRIRVVDLPEGRPGPFLPDELVDQLVDPHDVASDSVFNVFFEMEPERADVMVSVWVSPLPSIIVLLGRGDVEVAFGIATIVAAARRFGEGIEDNHILPPRRPRTDRSAIDPEIVVSILRQPADAQRSVSDAARALRARVHQATNSERDRLN